MTLAAPVVADLVTCHDAVVPDPADLEPLPARSVALSLVLGAHPAPIATRDLLRAGEQHGVPVPTMRVALTRAVAAGDLVRDGAVLALGPRLAARQRRQDEAVQDAERTWDGAWEMAVVVVAGRAAAERTALRGVLAADRLAELREGVWTRPANLQRRPAHASEPVLRCFTARPADDPAALAAALWDLEGWAARGRDLLALAAEPHAPAVRLAVHARLVRHLSSDPLLPAVLLPPAWPGPALRAAYDAYRAELRGAGDLGSPRGVTS